jgi:hypothetical protein
MCRDVRARVARISRLRTGRLGLGLRPALAFVLATVAGACDEQGAAEAPVEPAPPAVKRGDRVVVERRAAEFVEARVLQVLDGRLKLQTVPDRVGVTVAAGDAYPIAAPRAEPSEIGVCRVGPAAWSGCKLQSTAGELRAALPDGSQRRIQAKDVVSVSELTRMNIQSRFGRAGARREFERAAERAGRPRSPKGWTPGGGERVVARRDTAWFSATVHEIEDDGVRVRFRADDGETKLDFLDVVPEPPHATKLERGAFALRRPASPAEAWVTVRVKSARRAGLVVEDANGDEHEETARELIPLLP